MSATDYQIKGENKTINELTNVWEIGTGKTITNLKWTPDGFHLMASTDEGLIKVWKSSASLKFNEVINMFGEVK